MWRYEIRRPTNGSVAPSSVKEMLLHILGLYQEKYRRPVTATELSNEFALLSHGGVGLSPRNIGSILYSAGVRHTDEGWGRGYQEDNLVDIPRTNADRLVEVPTSIDDIYSGMLCSAFSICPK
jgi:hypothetical protein